MNASEVKALIGQSGHTLDAERATTAEDDLGGRTRTWSAFSTGVSAWVQPASARTVASYAALRMTVTHTVFLADDLSLATGDRLKFGERYLVVRGVRNVGEAGVLWQADAEEVSL